MLSMVYSKFLGFLALLSIWFEIFLIVEPRKPGFFEIDNKFFIPIESFGNLSRRILFAHDNNLLFVDCKICFKINLRCFHYLLLI